MFHSATEAEEAIVNGHDKNQAFVNFSMQYKYFHFSDVRTIATNYVLISRCTAGAIIYHERAFLSKRNHGPRFQWQYRGLWHVPSHNLTRRLHPARCGLTSLWLIGFRHEWTQYPAPASGVSLLINFLNSAKSA